MNNTEDSSNNGHEQIALFESEKDWEKEWQGMPEFKMGNTEPYQKITISFQCRDDVVSFGKLIGQRVTGQTDSLWFPKQENYIAPKNFRYVDES